MTTTRLSKEEWPKDSSDAVSILDLVISDKDKEIIRNTALGDLDSLRMGLGSVIRQEFGLWQGNKALITSTFEVDPDLACMTIIREFWDLLNEPKSSKLH